MHLRSWLASHKASNATSPAKGIVRNNRHQKESVVSTQPRNGIAVSPARTSLPLEEKLIPVVAVQKPSTIVESETANHSRQPSLKLSKSVSLASTRTVPSSSVKSRSNSVRSRSNTGSMKSQKIEMEMKEEEDDADGSDYDVDDEPSLKLRKTSPMIDTELAMLRKAQYSGYNLLYDQIRDFNEPVEV